MPMNIPNKIFEFLMRWEGGSKVTNATNDNGGLTKYGISQNANPDLDIANLTEEQAKSVYLDRYWTPSYCYKIPDHMQLIHFNCAVNTGVRTSIKLLQKTVGAKPDGSFGEKTMAKIVAYGSGQRAFVITYTSWLLVHYLKIIVRNPTQQKWARGWFRRTIDAVLTTAINLKE